MEIVGPDHPEFWDPERYLPQLKIRAKSGKIVPFDLFDQQRIMAAGVRRAYAEGRWLLHIKPRQEGSSTFFTGVVYQHAAHRHGCYAAILAHKKGTAQNLANIAIRFHRYAPPHLRPPRTRKLQRSLEFPGHDAMLTVAGVRDDEPLRGDTVQVLLATEISSWSGIAGPDAWASALNAVPEEYGFVIGETTPKHYGDESHILWDQSQEPGSKWLGLFIPWTHILEYRKDPPPGWRPNPVVADYAHEHGLSEAQAYWMETVGLPKCANRMEKFRAEYPISVLDCWVHAGDEVFDSSRLMAMLREIDDGTGLAAEHKEFEEWGEPLENERYIIACDPAGSWAKRNYFGIEVWHLRGCEQVAEYQGHEDAWRIARRLADLGKRYNTATIYVEANGVGEAVLSHLLALGYRNVHFRITRDARKPGWWSSSQSKAQAVADLQQLITDGSLKLRSTRCIRQLMAYRGQWDKIGDDAEGGHFDLTAASCIAAWAWKREVGAGAIYRPDPRQDAQRRLLDRILRGDAEGGWNTPWGQHR